MYLRESMDEYSRLRILSDLKVLSSLVLIIIIDKRWSWRITEGWMWSVTPATRMTFSIGCDQQVTDLLHVDFQEAYCDSEDSLVWILLDVVKDVWDGPWHNTELVLCCGGFGHLSLVELDFRRCLLLLLLVKVALATEDRVRFAWACLTVGHDDPVKAVENVIDDGSRDLGKRHVLARLHLENTVESEVALVETRPHKGKRLFIVWMVCLHALHPPLFTSLSFLKDEKWPYPYNN